MRVLPDGRLDRSFSHDGIWQVGHQGNPSSFVSEGPSSVTIQHDGGVLVAGSLCQGSECDFAVRRLTKRGQLDRSFGDDGLARVSFPNPANEALSIARTSQGKIVVGGVTCSTSCDLALARLNSDGSLNHSFGRNGKVVAASPPRCFDGLQSMALDSHNRIVLGGVCPRRTLYLVRFKPDGAINRSFADRGQVTTRHVHIQQVDAPALAIDSHDRIDVGGGARAKTRVFRYNPNGSVDHSFGNDGIATARYTDIRRTGTLPRSAAIDHRGRIVLAGEYFGHFGFTRLKPGGRLDRSFGDRGRVTIDKRHFRFVNSVAVDSRNRIVGAGYQRHGSPPDNYPAAVRLLP